MGWFKDGITMLLRDKDRVTQKQWMNLYVIFKCFLIWSKRKSFNVGAGMFRLTFRKTTLVQCCISPFRLDYMF